MKSQLLTTSALAITIIGALSGNAFAQTQPPALSGSVQTTQNEVMSEKGWLWMGNVQKTINLTEPMNGQFTHDKLSVGKRLILTLVNPTDNPMKFETSQRLGEEYSWTVAPHSQKIVSYIYTNPVSDEVRFMVSDLGDPPMQVTVVKQAETIRTQSATIQSQQGALASQQNTISSQQTTIQNLTERQVPEGRSAVRGYW